LDSLVPIQLLHRALMADRLAIDTVRSHGLVRVGNDNDPRPQRNVLPAATFGIASAVVVLVMMPNQWSERTKGLGWLQNGCSVDWMATHQLLLMRIESRRLHENLVLDSDLCNVMKHS